MIIGIDPGKTGAICYLGEGVPTIDRMPPSPQSLAEALSGIHASDIRVVVEKVSAGGVANEDGRRMGATSAFTFGRGFGCIEGVLAALRLPYELVTAQRWTAAMGEKGKDKNSKWAHAKRLYPDVTIFKYAADAVLIAEYGRRFLWPEVE